MDKIIIRYVYKRKDDGKIWMEIIPIESLEYDGDRPFVHSDYKEFWELISRDLYTGLKDRNGKMIFKNDVVNVRNWGQTDEILHTTAIEWDTDDKGWGYSKFYDIDRYDMFRNLEKIGNIHENPELLKTT